MTPSGIPGLGSYRGFGEASQFFDEWVGRFEGWTFEIESIRDDGDYVHVVIVQRGEGATSAAPVEMRSAQVVTVRDGQVVRIDNYTDLELAEAAFEAVAG